MVSMHLLNSCLLSYIPVYLLSHVIAMYSILIFNLDIYASVTQTFLLVMNLQAAYHFTDYNTCYQQSESQTLSLQE